MIELLSMLAGLAIFAAYWLWRYLRGDTVGTAKARMQGEREISGVRVHVVVKRHLAGGRPERVELQLWSIGTAKVFRLQPGEAVALARAIERGVAEARGES